MVCMKKSVVRIPKQKRAIQKRDSILEAGFILFSEKGYFNTDTAEIAKQAGVSTGIVYSYFKDKKAILDEVVSRYISGLETSISTLISKHSESRNLELFLDDVIAGIIASHLSSSKAQKQFIALSLLDDAIHEKFMLFKHDTITRIQKNLLADSSKTTFYKIHIAYELIEKVSHLYINDEITIEQFNTYKTLSIKAILSIFDKADFQ